VADAWACDQTGSWFVHLADWALNTSSPEGLKKALRRLPKEWKLSSLPTVTVLGPSRSSPEGAMARKGDKWRNMCAFVTDPLLNPSKSTPEPPVPVDNDPSSATSLLDLQPDIPTDHDEINFAKPIACQT